MALGCVGTAVEYLSAPKIVSWNDARVLPLTKAMDLVDRASMGFTPISKTEVVRLEVPRAESQDKFDAMLHIYGLNGDSRTVAFRRLPHGYKWIREQEVHQSGNKYKDYDDEFDETIIIEYQIEPANGAPIDKTTIRYLGNDSRLTRSEPLTLDDIKPILEEWRQKRRNKSHD